jgi:hypothetical protein
MAPHGPRAAEDGSGCHAWMMECRRGFRIDGLGIPGDDLKDQNSYMEFTIKCSMGAECHRRNRHQ